MNLPDLEHLDKIISLCRKRGVRSIKIDNVEITLGDKPEASRRTKAKQAKAVEAKQDVQGDVETDSLSPEELLMWSVGNGGIPFEGDKQ